MDHSKAVTEPLDAEDAKKKGNLPARPALLRDEDAASSKVLPHLQRLIGKMEINKRPSSCELKLLFPRPTAPGRKASGGRLRGDQSFGA